VVNVVDILAMGIV